VVTNSELVNRLDIVHPFVIAPNPARHRDACGILRRDASIRRVFPLQIMAGADVFL